MQVCTALTQMLDPFPWPPACLHACLSSGASWSAGINFTLVDLSCTGGDTVTVHEGATASTAVVWTACRTVGPHVVWQTLPASITSVAMLVVFASGSDRSSGVGTGWQVGFWVTPCITHHCSLFSGFAMGVTLCVYVH